MGSVCNMQRRVWVVSVICREKCGCHLSAEIPGAVFIEQFAKFIL